MRDAPARVLTASRFETGLDRPLTGPAVNLQGMQLDQFGVWTTYRAIGEQAAAEAARLVEWLGFGAFWLGGSPQLPAVRPLLKATERIVVATGVLNVWRSDPQRVARDFRSCPPSSLTVCCSASGSATPR